MDMLLVSSTKTAMLFLRVWLFLNSSSGCRRININKKKVQARRVIRRILRNGEWIRLRLTQKNHKASGTTNNVNIHAYDRSFVAKLRPTSLN